MGKQLPPIDLALIDSYYAVAAHLRSNAEGMLRTAEMLAGTADKMCEENIRLRSADSAGEKHGE